VPALPLGNYERVIIHDNADAINRFVGRWAGHVTTHTLGRYTLYYFSHMGTDIAVFATGSGSAQTNRLVEILSSIGCIAIIKIGTCSALHSGLKDADIVIPTQALNDEGATYWRSTKREHDQGAYNSPSAVNNYIKARNFVRPDAAFTQHVVSGVTNKPRTDCGTCVWVVDSYDCFDQSPALYAQVDGVTFRGATELLTGNTDDVEIAGVEMECSALFSSAKACRIVSAAILIVSRTRDYLLHANRTTFPNAPKFRSLIGRLNQLAPRRLTPEIEDKEMQCVHDAIKILGGLPNPNRRIIKR
jgi:uridine phosphorylase